MEIILSRIHVFIIVLIRIVTIMMLLPIFGYNAIPVKLKIGLSLFLAIIVFPLILPQQLVDPPNLWLFLYMICREVIIGLVIGFATILIFMAFQFAGSIVGMQMGFGIVNVIDPQSDTQVSIIGQLFYIVALLIFLVIDGHHFLIQALTESFYIIPVTGAVFNGKILEKIVVMSAQVFELAIKIGIPAIVALLLTSVALGVIARTVPQMNVFIVGFPLNIGLGLFVLAASLPLFVYLFHKISSVFQGDIISLIRLLAP